MLEVYEDSSATNNINLNRLYQYYLTTGQDRIKNSLTDDLDRYLYLNGNRTGQEYIKELDTR